LLTCFAFFLQSSTAIALFHYAAEALIDKFLDGRTLPETTRSSAVSIVRMRLIEGWVPVLDNTLRALIDEAATRANIKSEDGIRSGTPLRLSESQSHRSCSRPTVRDR
jgi:hypothetical protein